MGSSGREGRKRDVNCFVFVAFLTAGALFEAPIERKKEGEGEWGAQRFLTLKETLLCVENEKKKLMNPLSPKNGLECSNHTLHN
jgi:hypothetical protein